MLCVSCASPGPPKPPSLHLPELVKDLSAERIDDHVLLRWTTPSRTTDDAEIKGGITADLCREMNTKPSAPAAKLTACASVLRLPVASGPAEVLDPLPPALLADPVLLLTYRIQILNSTGHSAGESTPAYTVTGLAPAPVLALRGSSAEQGAVLEWRTEAASESVPMGLIDFKRVDLSGPLPSQKEPASAVTKPLKKTRSAPTRKAEENSPGELHLRATETDSNTKDGTVGTVDATATMGSTYTYTAQRIRVANVANRTLEIRSQPSAPVTVAMRDTFPPKIPTGLATISGNMAAANAATQAVPYVDLSWEPNSEPDLTGYRVYRQLARPDDSPQGPLARLTALPIAVPAYRDVAVRAGQGYIYSVTAVDAAGNESAPSAKALEALSPDAGERPH